MRTHQPSPRGVTTLVIPALLVATSIVGCQGGGGGEGGSASVSDDLGSGDSDAKTDEGTDVVNGPGPNGSYLFVSAPDFYFGTRDVGTRATQEIELVNRGADLYPINAVTVQGEHAEEFIAELVTPITLEPADLVRIDVTFAPIDEGRKSALIDIDFDTIVQVDDAVNRNEQTFYRARDLGRRGDYQGSLDTYREYIANRPVTVNRQRAAIRLPIIEEAKLYGADDDFALYLSAMNARDAGDLDTATRTLDTLLILHTDSYLADDALYLKAYIDLIDRENHAAALRSLQALRQHYPDTNYYDTALYGEALAQEGLGNTVLARSIYLDLRERHTGLDALGMTLPKDNLVSRLWFERASDGLDALTT